MFYLPIAANDTFSARPNPNPSKSRSFEERRNVSRCKHVFVAGQPSSDP
jgi:hypothetical protein